MKRKKEEIAVVAFEEWYWAWRQIRQSIFTINSFVIVDGAVVCCSDPFSTIYTPPPGSVGKESCELRSTARRDLD